LLFPGTERVSRSATAFSFQMEIHGSAQNQNELC